MFIPVSITPLYSSNQAMIDLEEISPKINQICRNLPVKKLGLFGSAVTDNFSQNSDVDVLVVFDRDQNINLFNAYFDLKEQLEEVFGRDVDLVVDKRFRNPIFRESVEKTRVTVYEK